MKDTVDEGKFIDAFDNMNRGNQFTVAGRRALYEYLIEFEDGTGTEIELDVIAFCCEFNEYEDIEEYLKDYGTDLELKDYEDEEEYHDAVKEEIQEKTTLIDVDGDSFIITAY